MARFGTVVLLCLTPAAAWAQPSSNPSAAEASSDVTRARRHFLRGVGLYREGDFRAAIIEFERAYKAAPNYKVLYNIGQAHLELQDYAAAHVAFERYLAEGGDELKSEQRKKVTAEILKLAGRVAKAEIQSNVDGATVLVDDLVVGTTPLADPITLSTGRRRITLQKEGYMPATQRFDVAGGDDLKWKLDLTPMRTAGAPSSLTSEPARSPAPVAPASSDRPDGMGTGFWVSLTATGVLAAGSGVFGFLALDAQSDNDDEVETVGVDRNALEDSKSDVQRYALGADILAGAAVVAGGLTLYFALDGGDAAGGSTEIGMTPGGATVRGTF